MGLRKDISPVRGNCTPRVWDFNNFVKYAMCIRTHEIANVSGESLNQPLRIVVCVGMRVDMIELAGRFILDSESNTERTWL